MQSLLVSESFGIVSFGTVFGLVSLASQAGSGLGPLAVGWLEDATGGYRVPFSATGGLSLMAAGFIWFARTPPPPVPVPVPIAADASGAKA